MDLGSISWSQAFLGLLIVAGLGFGVYTVASNQPADTGSTVQQPVDGEFDQALMAADNIEAPFANMNGFDAYTVDDDATQGTADVLDNAVAEWQVATGQDLGLVERSPVLWFEVDGDINEVEAEFEDTTGTEQENFNVDIEEVSFYDYEAAVDADSLSAGETGVAFSEVEGTAAEAELGDLSDGEYAVVPTFKWESGATSNEGEGVEDTLTTLSVEGDTDGDVDEMVIDFTTLTQ